MNKDLDVRPPSLCRLFPLNFTFWIWLFDLLWPPHVKSWLIGKDSDAGRDWGQEEKGITEDEMAGWHHWLDGCEFEWTPGVGDGQGGLACCDSWGRRVRHDWVTDLIWSDLTYLDHKKITYWTIKKAEPQRIGAFELWCWRRLLRVPWIARRSNQSILKEINPEYSLEGLMLKLKLQYFGHLIWRTNSLEKTLMLGKIKGRRRRGNRGWDDLMASPTRWTCVWASSRSWWWTGKPGVLQFMGQKESDMTATKLNWCDLLIIAWSPQQWFFSLWGLCFLFFLY